MTNLYGPNCYRAVVTLKEPFTSPVKTYKIYSRGYSTPGPAKAFVTATRRNHPQNFIDGQVEEAVEWKSID